MFNKNELKKLKKQFNNIIMKLLDRLEKLKNFDKDHVILPPHHDLINYDIIDSDIVFILICYNEIDVYKCRLSIPFKVYNNDKLFTKWCKDTIKQEKKKIEEIRQREILAGIIRPHVEKMVDKATEIIENQYINS